MGNGNRRRAGNQGVSVRRMHNEPLIDHIVEGGTESSSTHTAEPAQRMERRGVVSARKRLIDTMGRRRLHFFGNFVRCAGVKNGQ